MGPGFGDFLFVMTISSLLEMHCAPQGGPDYADCKGHSRVINILILQIYNPERERDEAALGQRLVSAIAIDLEDSGEAGQMRYGPFMFAVGLVDIGDARQLRAAPGPIVTGIGPELASLG